MFNFRSVHCWPILVVIISPCYRNLTVSLCIIPLNNLHFLAPIFIFFFFFFIFFFMLGRISDQASCGEVWFVKKHNKNGKRWVMVDSWEARTAHRAAPCSESLQWGINRKSGRGVKLLPAALRSHVRSIRPSHRQQTWWRERYNIKNITIVDFNVFSAG